MENIFYATIQENGKFVVRQAKVTKLQLRPCEIQFSRIYGQAVMFNQNYAPKLSVILAGLDGEFSFYDCTRNNINVYKSFEGAQSNDKDDLLFYCGEYNKFVDLKPFEFYSENLMCAFDTFLDFKRKTNGDDRNICTNCFKLYPFAYYWNGTKAAKHELTWSYWYDCLYKNGLRIKGYSEFEDKQRWYSTPEECTKHNYIEVHTF